MATSVKPLVAGNWKMNGTRAALDQIAAVASGIDAELASRTDIALCPPATLLYVATTLADDKPLIVGAQDCHAAESGAHTGDVSAEMIADCEATMCIVGHSERRTDHGETDNTVRAKAEACWRAELTAIICIGESEDEYAAGQAETVLGGQLAGSVPDGATAANTVIAYEPVWAIGTGRTPTIDEVKTIHGFLRARLTERFGEAGEAMRILYGGSVKPANAAELLTIDNVNGALVGGASLKATDFLAICEAYRTA